MVREWSYHTAVTLNRRCDKVWSPATMKTAMALRWRGTDAEQMTMATATGHGREGQKVGKKRVLTTETMGWSARTETVGRRRNRRNTAVDVAAVFELVRPLRSSPGCVSW